MGGRDHSIECGKCGVYYGGFNGPDECPCSEPDWDIAVRWNGQVVALCRLSALAKNLAMVAQLSFVVHNIQNNTVAWMNGAAVLWRPGQNEAAPGWIEP